MDDAMLMYSALLALTKQNVITRLSGPVPLSIGYITWAAETVTIWAGQRILDTFTVTPVI